MRFPRLPFRSRLWFSVVLFAFAVRDARAFLQPRPETNQAFEHYVKQVEARMERQARTGSFLWLDSQADLKAQAEAGEIPAAMQRELEKDHEIEVPGGLIQHWVGGMYLRGATLTQVRSVLQDYAHYPEIYRPEVLAAKVEGRQGDEYDVFLRLYKKQIFTVVLNSRYKVKYVSLDPQRLMVRSLSTHIAEVADADRPERGEKSVESDRGFLWRINTYWRLKETPGGVYVECETISLSRDVPALLRGAVQHFVKDFPRDSLRATLSATRRAAMERKASASFLPPRPDQSSMKFIPCRLLPHPGVETEGNRRIDGNRGEIGMSRIEQIVAFDGDYHGRHAQHG